MNKASRLEPLADYAASRETEAARRLAVTGRELKAKEAELEQLRSYLAEYRQRAELDTTDSTRWQNARAFLARLSDAVAFHEAEVAKAVERYRFEADRWRDSHQRSQTLDKVVERSQREERHASEKRDQAELDERALWQMLEPRR